MHMKQFGPLVNLWEGSNQGEGYLRFAKTKITDIHTKNWQKNAHKEIFNEMALDQVFECHVNTNYTRTNCCAMQDYINSRMNRPKKMYMKYKSVNEIFSSFRKNRPISAVRFYNKKFFVIIRCSSVVAIKFLFNI